MFGVAGLFERQIFLRVLHRWLGLGPLSVSTARMQSLRRKHICFASVYGGFSPLHVYGTLSYVCFHRILFTFSDLNLASRRRYVRAVESVKFHNKLFEFVKCFGKFRWRNRRKKKHFPRTTICMRQFPIRHPGELLTTKYGKIFKSAQKWKTIFRNSNLIWRVYSSSRCSGNRKCAWTIIELKKKKMNFMAKRATHSLQTVVFIHTHTHRTTKTEEKKKVSPKTKACDSEAVACSEQWFYVSISRSFYHIHSVEIWNWNYIIQRSFNFVPIYCLHRIVAKKKRWN